MVKIDVEPGKFYWIKEKDCSEVMVGQRAANDWFPHRGGGFWVCGSDEIYFADNVTVIREIEAPNEN